MDTEMMSPQNETKNNEKIKKFLIIAAVVVVAAAIIGLVVYNALADSGYFVRRTVAAETENYTVNGSMMTYFFFSNYNQYAPTLQASGMDPKYTLKSQVVDEQSGATWFDYMASLTASYIQELLALCEGAKANGITLEAEDEAIIDASIDSLAQTAAEYGYDIKTYLLASFGSAVKEEDVRECLKLTTLAAKYYASFNDGLSYTDADYEKYYESNKTSYDVVDLMVYTIKQSDLQETDENGNPLGNISDAAARAKEQADIIAAAGSEEEFKAALQNYFMTVLEMSEEEAAATLETCTVTGLKATPGNPASDWAFSAKAGDTTVVNTATSNTCEVYYLLKSVYRNEAPTRDVRHILLTSETYGEETEAIAKEMYALWEESGFDLDTFTALCVQYTEDPGSQMTGGVYAGVSPGQMVPEFNDWLFDAGRKEGDAGLVQTTYGWHIMYYDGEGLPAWKLDADNALRGEAYTNMINEYSGNMTIVEEAIYAINA